jgi:predicted KAP-like P-loop ATPase
MWADNETSEDLLGFKVHADLLINVIRDDAVLPVTIGVFGDWGSGKSSILKIVKEELSPEEDKLKDDTLVLYFNGWVFEGYDDAKAALLESIIEKFEKHKTLGNRVKDQTTKLLRSVKWMRVLGLGFKKVILPTAAAYLTGGLSLVPFFLQEFSNLSSTDLADKLKGENAEEFLKEIIEKHDSQDSTLVREFREDFKEMIEKSQIKKLVVIIDDLDRCQPDRIIENLEAIKLFLNVEKTAFVIGADPRIVRHAIEYRYKTDGIENANDPNSRNKRIVSDYLEKLIQIPYNLPRLSDNEVETYMTLLFCKRELGQNFSKVLQAFYKHRTEHRHDTFGIGNIKEIGLTTDEIAKLDESITLIASLSSIITEGLNGNPRQIKRFLNTFTLRNRLVKVAGLPDFNVANLAKLMVLEYSNPELFRQLYEWQISQNGEAKELVDLEKIAETGNKEELRSKYSEWASDKALKWLNVEPKFSSVDLRDYFWISRDHLTSSFSGASLIPIHIRSLAGKLIGHGSGTILVNTVTNEVVNKLSDTDLIQLLSLLDKELSKSPENDKIHKVYIELIAQKVTSSISAYSNIISRIDNTNIPFSLRGILQLAAKKNPDIETLYKVFKADSSIGKALNQKK